MQCCQFGNWQIARRATRSPKKNYHAIFSWSVYHKNKFSKDIVKNHFTICFLHNEGPATSPLLIHCLNQSTLNCPLSRILWSSFSVNLRVWVWPNQKIQSQNKLNLFLATRYKLEQVEIVITNLDLAEAFSRYQRLVCISEKINPLFSELWLCHCP